MKKIFKELSIYSLPFLGIVVLLFFINIIKKDFILGHFLHNTYHHPYNWFKEFTLYPVNNFFLKLKNDKKIYLPQVFLYVSESKLNSLSNDLPKSAKIWKSGKAIHHFDNNKLKDINLRLRSDNPKNWILNKKSYRIKLRKNQMNGRYRYYNYLPFESRLLTSNQLASKLGILAPKVQPIELILNEEKKGLYLEIEHFNENFLRRNKIMPVNFYKGENFNQDTKIGLGKNLYNSIGLWNKQAYFNFYEKDNDNDLRQFLKTLKQSKNNLKKFEKLKTYIDKDYFGRYLAYIILSQNYHTSRFHNTRIIFDPWKGQIFPVVTDPNNNSNFNYNFDHSANDLTSILNQSSEFINLKFINLYKNLFEKNILQSEIESLKKIQKNLTSVIKNDPTKINIFSDLFIQNQNFKILEEDIKIYEDRQKILKQELTKIPNAYWKENSNNFSLILDSQLPVNKIELTFDQIPEWVFIDENYNNSFDANEIKFFKNKNKIILNANLLSNRVNILKTRILFEDNIGVAPTKFNFISSNGKAPSDIKINNYFLDNFVSIKKTNKLFGSETNSLNKVLYNSNKKKDTNIKILSGQINVTKDLIFNEHIKIKPGTTFLLSENVSIIFKNQVEAIGEQNNRITFKPAMNKPWGTVALLGKKTSGSIFDFVKFSGGSGKFNNQYYFTSMFSVHNTSDIKLKNLELADNSFFDDMLHIIYGKDVILENSKFLNANGDAVDIDISENVRILNSNFLNSKNDGIDLMESKVKIENVNIINSKDKGVSIGESSIANIFNVKLEKNETAIAIKDNSKANIDNTSFFNNKNQVSSYKKNLQYGSGGYALITKSIFKNDDNIFSSSDSKLIIKDSQIFGKVKKIGTGIVLND